MNFPVDGIRSERLHLRLAHISNASLLLDYQLRNRDYLQAWEPLRSEDFYQLKNIQQRLVDTDMQMQENKAFAPVVIQSRSRQNIGRMQLHTNHAWPV